MKRIRKVTLLLLILVLFTSTFQAASAKEVSAATINNCAIIRVDDAKSRVAESIEGGYIYRAAYNKRTSMMSISKTRILTKEICEVTWVNMDPKATSDIKVSTTNNLVMATYSQSLTENTFSNYEYTKWYGSTNKWELRRPDSTVTGTIAFKTYQTTKNKTYLLGFYNTVNAINKRELTIVGLIGTTALIAVVGYMFSGGIAAFLGAAGFSTPAMIEIAALQNSVKVAKDYYWDAYYSSVRF